MSEYDFDLSGFEPTDANAWDSIWDLYPDFGNYTVGGQPFADWTAQWAPPDSLTNFANGVEPNAPSALDRWVDGLDYDTQRGVIVDRSGQPVTTSPQASDRVMQAIRDFENEERRIVSIPGTNPSHVSDLLSAAGGKLMEGLKGLISPGVLSTLALGGLGLGASRLITGGQRTFTPPAAPPPPASQMAARTALTNALTTAPGGGPAGGPGVPGPNGMPGTIPNPFALSGNQNLENIFRSGLAGQSILANLAAMQALRESGYDSEQAPAERALRLGALAELPQYLYSRPASPFGGMPMPATGPGGTPYFNPTQPYMLNGQMTGGAEPMPANLQRGAAPPNGMAYAGGTPNFNEATGRYADPRLIGPPATMPGATAGQSPFQMTMMPDGSYGFVPTPPIPTQGVNLYAGAPPNANLGVFNQAPTHNLGIFDQAPTHNLGAANGIDRSGRLFSRGIEQVMGNVGPDGIPRISDPIRAALQRELMTTMAGDVATPEIERREAQEDAQLRTTLFRSLGEGYESSTPGMQALQTLRDSQAQRRDEERLQRIGLISPQEFARRQFEYAAPLQALNFYAPNEMARGQFGLQRAQFDENTWLGRTNAALGRAQFNEGTWLGRTNAALNRANFDENTWQNRARFGEGLRQSGVNDLYRNAEYNESLRQRGLAERLGMLGLGRYNPQTLQNSLSSMVPINPLLGLNDTSGQQNYQNSFQAALAAFQAQEAERARLGQGIAGIFGTAAGALTPRYNITLPTGSAA